MSVKTLKERHANIVLQAQARLAELTESGEPIAESDRAAVDEMVREAAELNDQIETVSRLQTLAAEGDAAAELWAEAGTRTGPPAVEARDHDAQLRALGLSLLGGPAAKPVDVNLRAVHDEQLMIHHGLTRADLADAQRRGYQLAFSEGGQQVRAYSVGTDGSGGYLVPTLFERTLYDYAHYIGGVRRAGAEVITTSSGAPLDMPTVSAHFAPSGTLETSEAAEVSSTDDTLSEVTLNAYAYTGEAQISKELLQDSMVDVESMVGRSIGRTIGIKTESKFNLGTGTNMPKGAFHSPASSQTVTTGTAVTLGWKDLSAAVFGLDATYLGSSGVRWSMAAAIYGKVIEIVDDDGRPLFLPALVGASPENSILGYPVVWNGFSDNTVAANKIVAAVGSWMDAYVIREVGNVEISASPHVKFRNRQVVFLGELRADGKIRDTKALRYVKVKAS